MRNPLWIINSIFLVLIVIAVLFMVVSRQEKPIWEDLTSKNVATSSSKKNNEITISKIYERDIFGSYEKPDFQVAQQRQIMPVPRPPVPQEIHIPVEAKPQFLPPLNIVLKGIMIFSMDDTKNRAIVADGNTKIESVMAIGNLIEDAQLIKIFNHKVVFLRSNGQQEILYLREKDAENDPMYSLIKKNWHGIITKIAEGSYRVNATLVQERVTSLAGFIDMFELTTVYKDGVSIGCRVGKIASDSLPAYFGFEADDIIVKVAAIPTVDTANRLEIYKKVIHLQPGETIDIVVLRNRREIVLHYTVDHAIKNHESSSQQPVSEAKISPVKMIDQQINALQAHHTFAPTLEEIRSRERENMLQKGRLSQSYATPNERAKQ